MKLLQLGKWKKNERLFIENWIKEDNFDDKRAAAANLVSVMIPEVMGEDCSTTGKIKSKRIGQTLHYFEDLLITTKAGIARKFYRDHLNHMLRVMLLANAICSNVEPFTLLKERINVAVLSSLIHDIAYPIAESYHIFGETVKSMSKCYETVKFPEFKISFKKSKIKKLTELLGTKVIPKETLHLLLNESDHGLIGAMEFVDYVNSKKLKDYKELFEAVTFHNTESKIPSILSNAPMLKVLILSDELQDWGRPIGVEKEAAMPAVRDFNMTSNSIEGIWEWKNYSNISPLRQVYSKLKNLGRIEWPEKLKIHLGFELPKYRVLEIASFQGINEAVIGYCKENKQECIEHFNESWQNNKELFKIYYGTEIPDTENLFDLISAKTQSMQYLQIILFDSQGKEALITSKAFAKACLLKLVIEEGKTKLVLSDGSKFEKGLLFSQGDLLTKNLLERFSAAMIIFHGLTSRISQKASTGLASIYPYPSASSVNDALRIVGIKDTDSLIEDLRILRRCMVDRGMFAFERE